MNSVLRKGSHVEPSMSALDQPPAVDDLAALIEIIAGGDTAAISAFYDATCRAVYNLVLLLVDDVASAEEVLLETYIAVRWRALAYRQHPCTPLLWVLCIAYDLARDKRYTGVLAAAPEKQQPKVMLAALSIEQRGLLALTCYSGASYLEIAACLQLPAETIKSHLFRAMVQLRATLSSAVL